MGAKRTNLHEKYDYPDWTRSVPSASSTGCSPVACQGSPLTATSSERTGAMASIRRCRMPNCAVYGLEQATKRQWRLQANEGVMQKVAIA